MDAASVRATLESAAVLAPCTATVVDTSSGCGRSFAITAVSDAFAGVRALRRHRMVHEALGGDAFMDAVHAVEIHCYTVAQKAEREGKEGTEGEK